MKAKRIIDLTGPLHEGTQALAGPSLRGHEILSVTNTPVRYKVRGTYHEHGSLIMSIEFDGEAGTYLLTPSTGTEGAPMVEDIPLADLYGDARLIYIPKEAEEEITAGEVKTALEDSGYQRGEILLLRTGWGDSPEIYAKWYNKEYVHRTPVLTREASQMIADLGVKTFGTDMAVLSSLISKFDITVYKIIDQKMINIVMCLVNLNEIKSSKITFGAFPLRVEMTSCPVRAVAIED